MNQLTNAMAEAARLAPSNHNSQPWRFVAAHDRLDVLVDPSRSTPASDPVGRAMWLACGAAVLNARVAARAAGRSCAVSLGPTPGQPDLVASLTLLGPVDASDEDLDLTRAVSRRHTVRTPFEPTPVPAAVVALLRHAAESEQAWLAVVSRPAEVVELAVLTGHAEAMELADDAYRHELASWLRTPGQDPRDGIPMSLVQDLQQHSSVPLRAFVRPKGQARPADGDAPPPVERPLLMVIGTDNDGVVDWIRAGMAMERLWLTATVAGLVASPMTQALDHAAFRARLSSVVSAENGHPQMLLRIGYGQQRPTTGRRSVDELLVHA
jgi:nitroreductase